MRAATAGSWLSSPEHDDPRLPHLVCLPWAGGSAGSFAPWVDALAGVAVVHRVRYPGRESRFGEPCVRDMDAMADAVAEAVRPLCARPTVLFGHSMGAAVAHEVALRCERSGRPPALVVVSGHPGPGTYRGRDVHRMDDEALLVELDRLAGEPGMLTRHPELREILLPVVRADLGLVESHSARPPAPIRSPLAVFRGADDPDVSDEQARAWRRSQADGDLVRHEVFPGGHFYLEQHADRVLAALSRLLGSLPAGAGVPCWSG
ncbi:pyochelin biosynthetic protein PchC [Pseudonocardia sediminis]|uniref:Pyochelin biosynthetic protein PchC n=1 Tax=Pseudonocardia sediminis TaxID=1397368 RepID=A0A4Q7V275_PSEST|nr:alpha/beta fold hydrolase [Pseudonocardia sediminis]RZT88647.1 pyochelin biosynthetic protein PchC [Pseudonocardia sediminis]